MTRETSLEAYRKIQEDGLLSKRRWEVYESLFKCGPATAMGIFNFMAQYRGNKVAANVYARLSELRDMGCVREVGDQVDPMTRMRVILWDVTKSLPVKFEKAKRHKCPHCRGRGYLEEAQAKMFS